MPDDFSLPSTSYAQLFISATYLGLGPLEWWSSFHCLIQNTLRSHGDGCLWMWLLPGNWQVTPRSPSSNGFLHAARGWFVEVDLLSLIGCHDFVIFCLLWSFIGFHLRAFSFCVTISVGSQMRMFWYRVWITSKVIQTDDHVPASVSHGTWCRTCLAAKLTASVHSWISSEGQIRRVVCNSFRSGRRRVWHPHCPSLSQGQI